MRKKVAILALGMALWAGVAGAAEDEKERLAVAAALSWLALVDDGGYVESWNGACEYFRKAVTAEQWKQSLGAVRSPLGSVVSREVASTSYQTSLPGAPDGEYVVVQLNSVFEHKKAAVETVTPMLEADGKWRVSGYYIK
ncbi:MAG: DUF4019 domain-containing protein [Candidatus Schekmanbacteria bacterium]|nr:DUF4019 domain-containing protein [Candidatus Schekmanbacteria bacterium]